ncbi:amidase-like isoform X2 [Oculina patagonica]
MAEGKKQEKLYKEPAVRVPSLCRLSGIAKGLGLDIEADELTAYREAISSTLADTYQRLYELPDPKLPVKYPRTPGYRPAQDDNPYNAWYWRCDIKGASNGKLYGKTVAVKDNTCVAGVPMMNGSLTLQGFVPDVDATVVSRILDAGGNIVGKSVVEDLCCSGGSFTAHTGPVVNPHNNKRMAGGSSSGSAALVAGGKVDMATGGDQGGSIRIPSAACGIVGLKPTYGLVPYTGIASIEYTLDHAGPMARTVYDTALMLEAMSGYEDGLDPRQPRDLKIPEYTAQLTGKIDGLKIGILKEGFGLKNSEADVDKMVREAAGLLGTKCGAVVEEVSIPMHSDGTKIFGVILQLGAGRETSAEMYYDTTLQEASSRGLKCHSNDLSKSCKFVVLLAKYLQEDYNNIFYGKAQNLGRELCKAYDEALQKYDVLILPTIPKKAPVFPQENPPLKEYLERAFESVVNCSPTNVTGHPALSINAGFSDGLPVGMMIVGRKFDEATVLNVAYAYEKIRDAA